MISPQKPSTSKPLVVCVGASQAVVDLMHSLTAFSFFSDVGFLCSMVTYIHVHTRKRYLPRDRVREEFPLKYNIIYCKPYQV